MGAGFLTTGQKAPPASREVSFLNKGVFLLNSRSEIGHWVERKSRGTSEIQVASTRDLEKRRCQGSSVHRDEAQRPAGLGASPSQQTKHRDSRLPAPPPWLPGPRVTRVKGCGRSEWLGARLLQAPDPNPTQAGRAPRSWPGIHADTTEEPVCLPASEGDGNGCSSQTFWVR